MYRRILTIDEVALIPDELKEVMRDYTSAGFEIYLVGGGVRNILVGKVPENSDLTTNATPEQSMKILKRRDPFYNNDFGTVSFNVKVGEGDELYEITTYRSEKEYSDFRRPDEVTWGKTLEEDVVRRDLTVNAIVIGEKGGKYELIDMVDGLKDFESGVIRAVGDPEKRFGEDALRMMRAIRFAARLGFKIEEKTLEAISSQSGLLSKISRERVRDELFRILVTDYPADGVQLMISTGLMKDIMPELLEGRGIAQGGHHQLTVLDHAIEALRNCPSSDVLVRLAALIHDIGKPRSRRFKCRSCEKLYKEIDVEIYKCEVCGFIQDTRKMITFYGHEVIGARMTEEIVKRLRLTSKQSEKMVTMVRQHMFAYQPEMTDAAIRRLIRKIGKENISDMIMLRIADRKGSGSRTTSWRFMELQKRIGEQLYEPMEVKDMAVNGKDVMEVLGVPPGPVIGKTLNALFEEVIEDTSKNNRDYLIGRIRDLGRIS
ncbi:MAG: Polynucleotide adenylyltransferase/metal dependent phosphohydrolase [Candidatus Collierbacteria bacterium GW2011_GWF1_44_12]|uniref:Polynucleotide adenylyltransferase/metal dependent phosphohydrolase n=1 Tax=Candidatus Collierbacteria bacterium GW2011_GWF1_44_12 TaxID=1618402 RepID=A0A0G1GX54_9BACT|nr:MAG: Polynucleotide adenylyltransferase/metal dependent phosphohydrolase [Candidatus Collierbacteria bacterium GW2011_GWF1_44_12]